MKNDIIRGNYMDNEKIFQNVRIQMYILRSRGVIIGNKKRTKKLLLQNNYYNVVNGYKQLFLASTRPVDKYKFGTRFDEIYAVYEFDMRLRDLTLQYLLKFETTVKSIIAYTFSEKYGHKDYLNYSNFSSIGSESYQRVSSLFTNLYNKISMNIRHKDVSVIHYVENKKYIPLWVLVNLMSFGDLSKFYSCMKQSDRNKVSKRLKWGLRENELKNYLEFLSAIRNRCAHSERLYSYESHTKLLGGNKIYRYFREQIDGRRSAYFAVIASFKSLLSKEKFNAYIEELNNIFFTLGRKLKTITIQDVYREMDIPNNWEIIKELEFNN